MADVSEDLFGGITIPELLAFRRSAQDELFLGVIQSVSTADTTTTIFGKMSPSDRIRLINKVLHKRDPISYPINQPVKRTVPCYQ